MGKALRLASEAIGLEAVYTVNHPTHGRPCDRADLRHPTFERFTYEMI